MNGDGHNRPVVEDWKFVAQVLDRMFLWTFLLVSVIGSIFLFIPVIHKWAKYYRAYTYWQYAWGQDYIDYFNAKI
ncbi:unnamed protein product [Ranitomeya imitator]|uniref:Neurotransmitter-gated ion-channel transmembrane domain-containing protein n=1 Tax=Ranitomeya imitator TaxID=111125 RepID=A0ABN9LTA7_9NEOB|nr:unnamed protein product [Ranitomeya imitator]